ncbi:MAG: MFS transporter [Deltaproteobacteria bacterium]|nr:MAG: MFS transporter [Deltaproteobacteria bacterium]
MKPLKNKLPFPSYGMLMLISCGTAFGCYFASNMRLPVVPLYAKSLNINTTQIGFINAAFFLIAGFLSLPLGFVSDRLGRKVLASIGLLVLSSSFFMLYFSDSFILLTLSYLFIGAGMAAFGPTMMSFVADISPATHLGRSYGWYTTALYCGMSLGPAAGGFVAQAYGYIQVFLISGTLVFLIFWIIVFFLPRTRSVLETYSEKPKTVAVLRQLFKNRPLMGCWLVTLGGCFGLGMFVTFIPLHAQNQGLNISQIGFVFFAQGLTNALSRIPLGYLSDKVADRKILVVIGIIGFAIAMAGFGMSRTVGHFMMFAIALGVSMGLAFTSVGALIAETVDSESRGVAMGGYNTCIYFGMMLNSALMGTIIQRIGFEYGFYLTAVVNVLFIAIFYLLMSNFSPISNGY